MSYYSGASLRYAKKSVGGSWQNSVVDNSSIFGAGLWSSIALNSSSNPVIVYKDLDGNDLLYAQYNGISWAHQAIYTIGNVGDYASLVIDSSNNYHVAYYDATGNAVYYAKYTFGSGWTYTHQVVASTGQYGISIAVANDGTIGIAYRQQTFLALYYAYSTNGGSSWTTKTVDDSTSVIGANPSLRFDGNNIAHISYEDSTNGTVKYAYGSGSSWTTTVADDSSTFPGTAVGSNGVFIAHYYSGDGSRSLTLMDNVAPTGTLTITGKAGRVMDFVATPNDFGQLGGPKYYCVDESNTCTNWTTLTSGSAISSSVALSSTSVNTIYFRLKDGADNVGSISQTISSQDQTQGESEKQVLNQDIIGQKIVNYDLSYVWKVLPENPENYWITTFRYNKYTKKYPNYKSNIIKRYWKINTNLYQYHKKARKKLIAAENNYTNCVNSSTCTASNLTKYKKALKKYQNKMFKVRFKFYYTQKLANSLRLKNSVLKKLSKSAAEKKLWLKVYNPSTKTWANMSKLKLVNNTVHNLKNNTFATDLRYFKQKNTLFTIGVK